MIINDTSGFVIASELNPWIDIFISVEAHEDFDKVKTVAIKAYDDWFSSDTCETISEYIKRILEEEGCSAEIYTKISEDEEEF